MRPWSPRPPRASRSGVALLVVAGVLAAGGVLLLLAWALIRAAGGLSSGPGTGSIESVMPSSDFAPLAVLGAVLVALGAVLAVLGGLVRARRL